MLGAFNNNFFITNVFNQSSFLTKEIIVGRSDGEDGKDTEDFVIYEDNDIFK